MITDTEMMGPASEYVQLMGDPPLLTQTVENAKFMAEQQRRNAIKGAVMTGVVALVAGFFIGRSTR